MVLTENTPMLKKWYIQSDIFYFNNSAPELGLNCFAVVDNYYRKLILLIIMLFVNESL